MAVVRTPNQRSPEYRFTCDLVIIKPLAISHLNLYFRVAKKNVEVEKTFTIRPFERSVVTTFILYYACHSSIGSHGDYNNRPEERHKRLLGFH